jgi:thiamine-phosphate pyrophosphorylase
MAERCVLYYITERRAFSGGERVRRVRLLDKIAEAASGGVDYIQLREKDLLPRELESLALEAGKIIRSAKPAVPNRKTSLLINSRVDVALAIAADGVHLPGGDLSPEEVRAAWRISGSAPDPLISVACHSADEVSEAAKNRATFAVFAPVFEKKDAPGSEAAGLDVLRKVCRNAVSVLALGGITLENADSCLSSGAAGIAGIRLFQENSVASIVRELRG